MNPIFPIFAPDDKIHHRKSDPHYARAHTKAHVSTYDKGPTIQPMTRSVPTKDSTPLPTCATDNGCNRPFTAFPIDCTGNMEVSGTYSGIDASNALLIMSLTLLDDTVITWDARRTDRNRIKDENGDDVILGLRVNWYDGSEPPRIRYGAAASSRDV